MTFAERQKIEADYYEWLKRKSFEGGFEIEDRPITLIAYLDSRGLIKTDFNSNERGKAMTDETIKIAGYVSDEFVETLKRYGLLGNQQKVKDIQTKAVDLYNALVGFKSDNLVITFDNGVKMEVTLSHEVKSMTDFWK